MAESWEMVQAVCSRGCNFMAGSKIVHDDGRPVVMYHGTAAQDVPRFPWQTGRRHFSLSYSPRFAGDFAACLASGCKTTGIRC